MPESITFTVPAVPKAQPRQRHRVITTATGRSFASNYTPKNDPVNAFKACCQMAAQQAYSGAPLEGPLRAAFVFVMPRPKLAKKFGTGRLPHAKAPDRDNLMKSLQDALNGLLWSDDRQIFAGHVEKWVAAADEQPHVEVTVEVLTAQPQLF